MNKKVRLWWVASGIMVLLFGLSTLMDYLRPASYSAPYWACLAVRAIEFLIPALLFAIIALYLQFRHKKKQHAEKQV